LLVRGGVETNPGPTLAEERKQKREYVLASICENAPEMEPGTKHFKKTAIRDCIRLYNRATDADHTKTNKAKFTGVDREILLATVNYLGGRDMKDFTKPAVIVALIERIDHHLPHACNQCTVMDLGDFLVKIILLYIIFGKTNMNVFVINKPRKSNQFQTILCIL
jgi:hypothetical protein